MSDALIKFLNDIGYVPVRIPQSGLEPPGVYMASQDRALLWRRVNDRLPYTRRGPLMDYAQGKIPPFAVQQNMIANMEHRETSSMRGDAAVRFLEQALVTIGLEGGPQLDLSFAKKHEMVFNFTGVLSREVDPSKIDAVMSKFSFEKNGISRSDLEEGRVFIAYKYLYASALHVKRADYKNLDISAQALEALQCGGNIAAEKHSETTISFSNPQKPRLAFAFAFAKVIQENGRCTLQFEDPSMAASPGGEKHPFVPARGVVIDIE